MGCLDHNNRPWSAKKTTTLQRLPGIRWPLDLRICFHCRCYAEFGITLIADVITDGRNGSK